VPNTYTDRKLSAGYPTDLPAWKALTKHYRESMQTRHLRELFSRDKKRAEKFRMAAADLSLDFSKTHVNATTLKLLTKLATEADVPAAIEAMFAGEKINRTEDRSVLHVALRAKISDMVALETPGVREQHPQEVYRRREHRYRRFGPGPGHGQQSAEALHEHRSAFPQCVQCRRNAARGRQG
jgi:hypothetical protein